MKFKILSTVAMIGVITITINMNTQEIESDSKPVEVIQEVNAQEPTEEVLEKTLEAKLTIAEEYAEITHTKEVAFNQYDVKQDSNLTVEQVQLVLEGTPLYPLASSYIELEEEYGLNALFVLSLTIEESGWGTSRITHDNNNISGQRINGVYRTFESKYACLRETYRLISNEYVNPNGKYYVGSSNIYDINNTYCPDTSKDSWANNIISISNKILKEKI